MSNPLEFPPEQEYAARLLELAVEDRRVSFDEALGFWLDKGGNVRLADARDWVLAMGERPAVERAQSRWQGKVHATPIHQTDIRQVNGGGNKKIQVLEGVCPTMPAVTTSEASDARVEMEAEASVMLRRLSDERLRHLLGQIRAYLREG